jgi:tetratricopeptide (TPR) repeat protein
MSREDDIRNLIAKHGRRLQKLKEKKASFGLDTPIHILTEIEDVEAELEKLQTELKEIISTISSDLHGKPQETQRPEKSLPSEWLYKPKLWFSEIRQQPPQLLKGVTIAGITFIILAIISLFADLNKLGFPIPTLANRNPTDISEQTNSSKTISIGGHVEDSVIIQSDQGDVTVNHIPQFNFPESTRAKSSFAKILIEGYELLMKNDLNGAEEVFEKARTLEPQSPEPWYWKSVIAMERSDYEVAQSYLNEALKLAPDHPHSLALKIKVLIIIGKSESANTLANLSYGISDGLDKWLDCLHKNGGFNPEFTYNIDFELKCPPFDYSVK